MCDIGPMLGQKLMHGLDNGDSDSALREFANSLRRVKLSEALPYDPQFPVPQFVPGGALAAGGGMASGDVTRATTTVGPIRDTSEPYRPPNPREVVVMVLRSDVSAGRATGSIAITNPSGSGFGATGTGGTFQIIDSLGAITNGIAGEYAVVYAQPTPSGASMYVALFLVPAYQRRPVILTTDMSAGTCSVKFHRWTGSAYAGVGTAFTAYDKSDRYWHAVTGEFGEAYKDYERNVWIISSLNTIDRRKFTLGSDLVSGGSAVTVSGRAIYPDRIRSGRKVASTGIVEAYADHSDKKWIADVSVECTVPS